MKASIVALFVFVIMLTSCKDSNPSEEETDIEIVSEERGNFEDRNYKKNNTDSNPDRIQDEADVTQGINKPQTSPNTSSENKTKPDSPNSNLSGNFIKMDEVMDKSCSCYCVNINYTTNSEICLTPSKVYINTRMEKVNTQTTNIFLVNPSSRNTEGKDIPWSKFDTMKPIAKITSKGNGEMELDWLGFYINGDLATDYAILGKKTLEGNYKKK